MIFGWIQRPIGGQVSDRDARDRRRRQHSAEPEAPNPDFDFGTLPSIIELARPGRTARAAATFVFLVISLLMMPLVILLVGFAVAFVLSLR